MIALNLVTFFNLSLIFLFLFFRKNNASPNRILAGVLFVPGISFLGNALNLLGIIESIPALIFFFPAVAFLCAPFVYLYTEALTGRKIRVTLYPFLASALLYIILIYYFIEFLQLTRSDQVAYVIACKSEEYPEAMMVIAAGFIIVQQFYFSIAAYKCYKYKKWLKDKLSNFDKTKLHFLTRFIFLIWSLNLIILCLYMTLPALMVEHIYIPIVVTIINACIIYYGFQSNSIFTHQSYNGLVSSHSLLTTEKSKLTTIDSNEDQIAKTIIKFLEHDKPYVNGNFDLIKLASNLELHPKKVSNAINNVIGKSFYQLINDYRVHESKHLLESNTSFSIEAIGEEAGFNSRSSFFRVFKKSTGLTPTEYIKNLS